MSKTKISAAAVACSVLAGSSDDEKKSFEAENYISLLNNCTNSKDLESVLVFALEEDTDMCALGLLSEQQVTNLGKFSKLLLLFLFL